MSHSATHHVKLIALACLSALLIAEWRTNTLGQEEKPAEPVALKKVTPIGQFLTLEGAIDDGELGKVKNVALELQTRALKEERKAILVLELTQGTSEYHQAYGLAKFLASVELSKVTTVAWVPKTVTGHNVIVALACNEIVMHPDAELGDVGRGQPLDDDERQSVLSIVEKVHNLKVSRGLATGMLDPQATVLKLSLGPAPDNITRTIVVTDQEAQRMRKNREPILKDEVIWEAGITGRLSGSRARRLDVLTSSLAETRLDVRDLYNLPAEAMRERADVDTKARVIVVEGEINDNLESYLMRQIDRAVSQGAKLLIFQIDSPGGLKSASERLADEIANLEERNVKTVAFVPHHTRFNGAFSGAAIICLGCDEIYLHPDAQIGDAGPIFRGPGGVFRAPEKILSPMRVNLRRLAERKGRPPALAEAMADKDLLVYKVTHKRNGRVWYMTESEFQEKKDDWVLGPVVPESRKDNLLTLSGQRAHELKIAGPPVEDLDDLKNRLGFSPTARFPIMKRTWVDTTVDVLNHPLSVFLLLVIGVACIYLELHVNTGFLGICSALCFGIFFWSKFLNGTAGWLEVVLFVLGIGCVVMEIFVIPGFGVFGVSGALLVFVSLVMASQTFGNLEPSSDLKKMTTTMLTLSASIGTVIGLAMVMNRYLPQIPLFNQMILQPPGGAAAELSDEPRLRPEDAGESLASGSELVGRTAEVFADLRPAGKIVVDGQYLDVVSEGPYIGRGQLVEIVSAEGNRVVVREAS